MLYTAILYFRAEKVILFARNRLRALIVFVFAHDMQIQVTHANKVIRLVTIAACYILPPVSPITNGL